MSFGFGVGDVFALSALAKKVYTAYKDAPNTYKHISEEVAALQILINKAVQHIESTTISRNVLHDGQQILRNCESVLVDLHYLVEKYQSLSSTNREFAFHRVKLDSENITTLRSRLVSNTTLLNGFIQRFAIQLSYFSKTMNTDCSTKDVNILKYRHG